MIFMAPSPSQVWLTIISSYVLIYRVYSFSIAVQEGSLLFFIIALVIAITIDYHFTDLLPIPKRLSSYVFTFFPMIICGVATFLYATRYLSDNNQLNADAFARVQYGILFMTVLYSLMAKFVMFFYQESS